MTPEEHKRLRLALRRASERAQIREAIAAGAVTGSIDLLLGNELIAASREVVAAWDEWDIIRWLEARHWLGNSEARIVAAIAHLKELVGRP